MTNIEVMFEMGHVLCPDFCGSSVDISSSFGDGLLIRIGYVIMERSTTRNHLGATSAGDFIYEH